MADGLVDQRTLLSIKNKSLDRGVEEEPLSENEGILGPKERQIHCEMQEKLNVVLGDPSELKKKCKYQLIEPMFVAFNCNPLIAWILRHTFFILLK